MNRLDLRERAWQRHDRRLDVFWGDAGRSQTYGISMEVGGGGLSMRTRNAGTPGSRVKVHVGLPATEEPSEMDAFVVWCEREESPVPTPNRFRMGVWLLSTTPEWREYIRDLDAEARLAARRPGN